MHADSICLNRAMIYVAHIRLRLFGVRRLVAAFLSPLE